MAPATGLSHMISLNLTNRIWLSFVSLILFLGLVIAVVYPLSIQSTLKEQSYDIIERQQLGLLSNFNQIITPKSDSDSEPEKSFIQRRNAERLVFNLVIIHHQPVDGDPVPQKVWQEMGKNAFQQKGNLGRYQLTYDGGTLFYVVRKVQAIDGYLISYMWSNYSHEMVKTLWTRLLWILLIAGLSSIGIAFGLARYLRHPLTMLGDRFEEIAKRNWKTSFKWEKDDEFKRLSDQFEHMRQNLLRYDESHKTFIQHASHELKTPIMVINSYAQSVKDGILPKKNLEETMDVIVSESERMQQRVKELIYYTKLDTLKDETPERRKLLFGPVAEEIVERLGVGHEQVTFRIEGKEVEFYVDRGQWQELIENLVENALRYAESEIRIEARMDKQSSTLQIYNDGETIPEEERVHLFNPFYKGAKGKFGLGLAIVKRIVELHNGDIAVRNETKGVRFIVRIPKQVE
jgi:two-component system sensor histidine kinase CssS